MNWYFLIIGLKLKKHLNLKFLCLLVLINFLWWVEKGNWKLNKFDILKIKEKNKSVKQSSDLPTPPVFYPEYLKGEIGLKNTLRK